MTGLTTLGVEHSEAAAAAMEAPREEKAAELADELRRNRPRMRGVEARQDVRAQAAQRVAPQRRPVVEREVVVAGRVRGRRRRAVIAERAEAAAGELEMAKRRGRLEADLAAGRGDAQREVGLEAIGGADEVLVEAAELEEAPALDRKIAGHDVRDETRLVGVEAKLEVVGGLDDALGALARLQDLADDGPHVVVAVRVGVRGDEARGGDDVVVEEEHDLAACRL